MNGEARATLSAMVWMLFELMARRAIVAVRFEREPLDRLLVALDRGPKGAVPDPALRAAIAWADSMADRVPWLPKTCLYRSLARFAALRARGIDARFVMGLPHAQGGDGHAWVELDGAPFLEEQDVSAMAVTFCYPPPSNASVQGRASLCDANTRATSHSTMDPRERTFSSSAIPRRSHA